MATVDGYDSRADGERGEPTPRELIVARLRDNGPSTVIDLPWPPSLNHYYRRTANGVAIGKAGIRYRCMVRSIIVARRIRQHDGRLAIAVLATPPDRRRRDLDNLWKCLLDSLQHAGMYLDDTSIKCQSIIMDDKTTKGGRLTVQLWES
jgi:crossover junction endodeoxyribonuclease RusA